jgi:hypothetical protein
MENGVLVRDLELIQDTVEAGIKAVALRDLNATNAALREVRLIYTFSGVMLTFLDRFLGNIPSAVEY